MNLQKSTVSSKDFLTNEYIQLGFEWLVVILFSVWSVVFLSKCASQVDWTVSCF